MKINEKGQAVPEKIESFGPEAFEKQDNTVIRWLGGAGALISSHGVNVMIDPVLSGFDMPLLIDVPIQEEEVPHLDAILLTHCDNDHYSRSTSKALAEKTDAFHAPHYVAALLQEELQIPGDSRLLEEQLHMPQPDAILFDFSDSRWHIGLDNAVRFAAAYPNTPLIVWHWGTVDAPEWKEFNGNPEELKARVVNPERVIVLNPGEPWTLHRLPEAEKAE